jgi:hypothetical protein
LCAPEHLSSFLRYIRRHTDKAFKKERDCVLQSICRLSFVIFVDTQTKHSKRNCPRFLLIF